MINNSINYITGLSTFASLLCTKFAMENNGNAAYKPCARKDACTEIPWFLFAM